jgi:hypothetical protein
MIAPVTAREALMPSSDARALAGRSRRLPVGLGPRRLRVLAAGIVAAGLLAGAGAGALSPPARAATVRGLGVGLTDDPLFLRSSPSQQAYWLGRARTLGSGWVRLGAIWAQIAPGSRPAHFRAADPADRAYNWSLLDQAVREAVAHGQTPVINVHGTPAWAEGADRPSWAGLGTWVPSAPAFGAFARALARRYSGHFADPLHRGRKLPRVRYFQAWNEPNLLGYLSPQWVLDAHNHVVAYSPGLYRSLLNAFYAGVKRSVPGDIVIAAGTAPYGDAPGQGSGRIQPRTFLEGLFCLNGALRRTGCPGGAAHLDGLDHHVYSPPWYSSPSGNDISVPDLNRIWSVLAAARRLHTVAPNTPKSLWISEFGVNSNPSDAAALALQAHYLELDLFEFWSEHVSNAFWFSLRDPGLAAGSFFATGGLITQAGTAKPAASAFRFPFVAVPAGHRRATVWGRAPRGGTVVIERLAGKRWRRVTSLRTGSDHVFYGRIHLSGKPQVRAVIGGHASASWTPGVDGRLR